MSLAVFLSIWGVVAVLCGLYAIVFRRQLSRRARAQRERRGPIGPHAQSPLRTALGGLIVLIAGIWITVARLSGWVPQ